MSQRLPAAFLTLLLLFTGSAGAKPEHTLRAADTHPDGYPTVEAVKYMGRLLEQRSEGRIGVKSYPGRQLGEERDTLEQTVFGAIDLNRVFIPVLNNVIKETMVLNMPFMFRDQAHADAVMRGPIGQEIFDAMQPFGLVGLAYYDSGIRSMYTAGKEIHHPDDLVGLRIRVPNSDVSVLMMESLGANATPMEFGQIYEGLRNGTIDGAENNLPAYSTTQHFQVAPVMSVTEHLIAPDILVMSKLSWDRLSSEDQALVKQAARDSMDYMRELWLEREQAALQRVTEGGARVVGGIEKQPFMDAVQPVYDRYTQDPVLADLVRRIRETR